MNIIFGRDNALALGDNYTVLELDTIQHSEDGDQVTAFCVVDTISILDMPRLESMKNLHANLLIEYRKKNWNYCIQATEHLVGYWNKELDSFYENLLFRIKQHMEQDPGPEWSGVINKTVPA